MNSPAQHDATDAAIQIAAQPCAKRLYQSPTLTWLGDIRDLTLGGSPGIGDSGGGANFKCPGCP
jgi:hypothetical protein